MFSMWMTHQLYAKILCCYFKTEKAALTLLHVVQRSIVFSPYNILFQLLKIKKESWIKCDADFEYLIKWFFSDKLFVRGIVFLKAFIFLAWPDYHFRWIIPVAETEIKEVFYWAQDLEWTKGVPDLGLLRWSFSSLLIRPC